MARLPVPNSDDGTWGTILNDFLAEAHNADGSLKPLNQSQIANLTADLAAKAKTVDLKPVATSGSYADLINKPTIPDTSSLVASADLDTKTAALVNNASSTTSVSLKAAFMTSSQVDTKIAAQATTDSDQYLTKVDAASNYIAATNKDHVSLLDFSAPPNGTTSNSAAFAAAIIAAENGPRRLYVPRQAQPWIIGTPVIIGTNADIEIYSDGWDTSSTYSTIKLAVNTNDYAFKFATNRPGGNHIVFRDIEIDGNCTTQTGGGGCVAAYNPVQCLFDHVHFHHAYTNALWLRGSQGSGPFGHHNRIVNSLFDNSAGSAGSGVALTIQASDESMIAQCDFESNGNGSYHIDDQSGINAFVNCVFVGGATAINGNNSSGSRVVSCIFDGVGGDSVHISGSAWIISANNFSGASGTTNAYKSVVLDNGGYCSVTGNVFDSGITNQALRAFISNYPSSTHNVINGNVFRINTGSLGDGGVYDWNGGSATSTNSVIRGNSGLADAG